MRSLIDNAAATNVIAVDFAPGGVLKEDPRPTEDSIVPVAGPNVAFAREGVCRHINISVYEDRAEVVCRDCGTKLNPIWVLTRMAREETKWSLRRKEFIEAHAELDERIRCKCQHCGQITPIKGKR